MFPSLPDIAVEKIGKVGFTEENDWLNRSAMAHNLSKMVDVLQEPQVIALNGEWGSGKSHFLKLWVGEHINIKGTATIIYFDAFQHDFLDDPLASLVMHLEKELSETRINTEKIKNAAIGLTSVATKSLISLAGAGYIVTAVNEIESAIGHINERYWENEQKRIAAMKKFKKELKSLVSDSHSKKGRKLVFIVDELDRCRPDYALRVLETIKHFFNMKNIHFVLGTNLKALEESVKASYGPGINAGRYLQKFINLNMRLIDKDDGNAHALDSFYTRMRDHLSHTEHPLGKRSNLLTTTHMLLMLPNVVSEVSIRGIQHLFSRLVILPETKRLDGGGIITCFISMVAILQTIDHDWIKLFTSDNVSTFEMEKAYDKISHYFIETPKHSAGDKMRYYDPARELCQHALSATHTSKMSGVLAESVNITSNRIILGNNRDIHIYLRSVVKSYFGQFSLISDAETT